MNIDIDKIDRVLDICSQLSYNDWRKSEAGSECEKIYAMASYFFKTISKAIKNIRTEEINNKKIITNNKIKIE